MVWLLLGTDCFFFLLQHFLPVVPLSVWLRLLDFAYSVLESCSTVRLPGEGVGVCHGLMRAFLGMF